MKPSEILAYEIKTAKETLFHQERLIQGLATDMHPTSYSIATQGLHYHMLQFYDAPFPLPKFEDKYYQHSTLFLDDITSEEEDTYWLLVGSTIEEIMWDASERDGRRPMWSEGDYLLDTLKTFYTSVSDFVTLYHKFWGVQGTCTYKNHGSLWLDTLMDNANMHFYLDQLYAVKEMRDEADFYGKRTIDEDILNELGNRRQKKNCKILQLWQNRP